jgi:hypothetical protein
MYDEVRLTNYLRQELISSLSRAHCGMTEIKLIQAESAELAGFAGTPGWVTSQVFKSTGLQVGPVWIRTGVAGRPGK